MMSKMNRRQFLITTITTVTLDSFIFTPKKSKILASKVTSKMRQTSLILPDGLRFGMSQDWISLSKSSEVEI